MKTVVVLIILLMMASAVFGNELVVFSSDSCGPCAAFKKDLEENPSMAGSNEVVFAGSDSEIWKRLGVKMTPTFMLFSESGELLKSKSGYRNRREFERWLNR